MSRVWSMCYDLRANDRRKNIWVHLGSHLNDLRHYMPCRSINCAIRFLQVHKAILQWSERDIRSSSRQSRRKSSQSSECRPLGALSLQLDGVLLQGDLLSTPLPNARNSHTPANKWAASDSSANVEHDMGHSLPLAHKALQIESFEQYRDFERVHCPCGSIPTAWLHRMDELARKLAPGLVPNSLHLPEHSLQYLVCIGSVCDRNATQMQESLRT